MATCSSPLLTEDHTPQHYVNEDLNTNVWPATYYTETNDKDRLVIFTTCQVCRFKIYLADNIDEQSGVSVASCPICKELTPFKAPPQGYKYVRCSCRMLMTCSSNSHKIKCHRPDCQKDIELRPREPEGTSDRYDCAYCPNVFEVEVGKKCARCDLCGRLSSLGEDYQSFWVKCYVLAGILFGASDVALAWETYDYAEEEGHWVIYLTWVVCGLLALSCFIKAGRTARIKTSYRLPNIN